MPRTLNVSLIVWLATNTRASDTAHRLATLLGCSGSITKHALDGLHDGYVWDRVMSLRADRVTSVC